ncbi:MAG TPA: glucose 1-dehydrogenase [Spirochaetia bacterium]|nr:glucose 1-dehydrogenase [Spirochaetia bacterium]
MAGNLFDLSGQVALVTGSSRGLGLVFARGLARAGARVVLNGRSAETVEKAAGLLRGEGLDAHGAAFNVLDRSAVESAVQAIEERQGPLGILVNNAGLQKRMPAVDVDEATWRDVLDTNLTGVFLVSQAVGRRMVTRRRGRVVNICSLLSEAGRPTIAPYTASKGGLKMLTKALAVEWAPFNVQVNGIGPGYFATEMNTALVEDPQFDRWLKARTPAGRWGRPEELVGTLVYLCSEAASFVTGQIVYVDGGILAGL